MLVHLCPAVPTAPKTEPITVILISESGDTIIALFPPSSKRDFPNLPATSLATIFPILVDPVAEIKGTLVSLLINSPTLKSPFTKQETPSGMLFSFNTDAIIF